MRYFVYAAFFCAITTNSIPLRTHDQPLHDIDLPSLYTWKGEKCDGGCQALKGEICGKTYRDCCKGDCEGGMIYDSCDGKGKYDKKQIDCSIPYKKSFSNKFDEMKQKAKEKAKEGLMGLIF